MNLKCKENNSCEKFRWEHVLLKPNLTAKLGFFYLLLEKITSNNHDKCSYHPGSHGVNLPKWDYALTEDRR